MQVLYFHPSKFCQLHHCFETTAVIMARQTCPPSGSVEVDFILSLLYNPTNKQGIQIQAEKTSAIYLTPCLFVEPMYSLIVP